MFERYSELARLAVFIAYKEAREIGDGSIDTEHLLIGILMVHPELPNQLAVEFDAASARTQSPHSDASRPALSLQSAVDIPVTSDLKRVMKHAMSVADLQQCREIRTEHLFASLIVEGGHAATILAPFQIEKQAMAIISEIDCSKPQKSTEASRQAMSSIQQMFSDRSDQQTPEERGGSA